MNFLKAEWKNEERWNTIQLETKKNLIEIEIEIDSEAELSSTPKMGAITGFKL